MALTATISDEGYKVENFPRLTPKFSLLYELGISVLKVITMPYSILVAQFAILQKGQPNEVHPFGA